MRTCFADMRMLSLKNENIAISKNDPIKEKNALNSQHGLIKELAVYDSSQNDVIVILLI